MKPSLILTISLALATLALSAPPEPDPPRPCIVAVTDATGNPVQGGSVEFYGVPNSPADMQAKPTLLHKTQTDAAGIARFSPTDDLPLYLVARKPGFAPAWATWHRSPGDEVSTNRIVLTSPASISGVVQDESGKPVPDAVVAVSGAARTIKRGGSPSSSRLDRKLATLLFNTRTASNGRFTITDLPSDCSLDLTVSRPGLALDPDTARPISYQRGRFDAGETNAILKLIPAGTILGTVVRENSSEPVRGAFIVPAEQGFAPSFEPTAAADNGTFVMPDLAPGDYKLTAQVGTNQFRDWVVEPVIASVQAHATNNDVKLIASRGGVLKATIRDAANSKPLAEASLSAGSAPGRTASGKSSSQGEVLLRLLPGDYHLYAIAKGFSQETAQATIEPGQTNELTLSLSAQPVISGTVVDSDGKPATSVVVTLFPGGPRSKQTDSDGRFSFPYDPNQYGVIEQQRLLILRDTARNLAATADVDESSSNLTVKLGPALEVTGTVTDPEGKPLAKAEVSAMFWTERMASTLGEPSPVDNNGRLTLNALPPARRYGIIASAPGYGRITRNLDAEETDTNKVQIGTISLPLANLSVAGVVLDAEDKPVAGANIYCYGDEQPQVNGWTDAKGRFLLKQVCPGDIRISANAPQGGGHGSVVAQGGDTNVTVQLGVSYSGPTSPNRVKITGTVFDPEGNPAPKVRVSLFPYSDSEKRTDDQGRFTVYSDPNRFGSSDFSLILVARDLEHDLAGTVDAEESTTEARIDLQPAITLVGCVLGPESKPIPNAQAQIMLRTDRISTSVGAPVRSGPEGKFEIKSLPKDRQFSITVSARDFGQMQQQVDTSDCASRRIELEPFKLLAADQVLAGTVLDAEDKPVANAWIYAYGENQPHVNGRTDKQGKFSFAKVCSGKIRLSANTSTGSYGSAMSEGGDTNIVIRVSTPSGMRFTSAPRTVKLAGKNIPNLAQLGLESTESFAGRPLLILFLDAEQRPSRRALRLLADQAEGLKAKSIAVIAVQAATMSDDGFAAWKQENDLPFSIGRVGADDPAKTRAAWGAGALPWLLLTDKNHRVVEEGFPVDDLQSKLPPE